MSGSGLQAEPPRAALAFGEYRLDLLGERLWRGHEVVFDDRVPAARYIQTVHRRGYRFVAEVRVDSPPARADAPTAIAVRSGIGKPIFVGRAPELEELRVRWRLAVGGERQIVFVAGEPGIGKTTLVDAFTATLVREPATGPALRRARAQCVEQHGAREPYLPLLDALEQLAAGAERGRVLALLRTFAPTWLAQIPWLIAAEELAEDLCGADAGFKNGSLDCSKQVSNGESGTTNLSDLLGCVGANAQSCYGQSVNSKNCCGCATSPASPFAKFWPAAASIACTNGINNPTWSSLAQPWLVFLKKGCPTAYTYAFDDSTSLFNCMSSGTRNEVGYSITFSSVPAPPIGDCAAAASARRSSSGGFASASSAESGCTAFLSRAVGYEARAEDAVPLPAQVSISDWIETASFSVKKPTRLVVREVSPDDVDWLSYPITRLPSAVKPRSRRGIVVRDELGTHTLDTLGADGLLVPSSVGQGKASGVPLAGLFDVYKCHRVKPAAGSARPHPVEIGFIDASGPQHTTVLSSPDSLCIEADLGEGLGNEQANVACYRVRSTASGPVRRVGSGAGRLPVLGTGDFTQPGVELEVENRFGSSTLDRRRAKEVCVPIEVDDRGR